MRMMKFGRGGKTNYTRERERVGRSGALSPREAAKGSRLKEEK